MINGKRLVDAVERILNAKDPSAFDDVPFLTLAFKKHIPGQERKLIYHFHRDHDDGYDPDDLNAWGDEDINDIPIVLTYHLCMDRGALRSTFKIEGMDDGEKHALLLSAIQENGHYPSWINQILNGNMVVIQRNVHEIRMDLAGGRVRWFQHISGTCNTIELVS